MFGGAAGFTPSQIRSMHIQDFQAVSEGFAMANGAKRQPAVCSDEELLALGIEV